MGKTDFKQIQAMVHVIDALDAAHKAALDAGAQFLADELYHCHLEYMDEFSKTFGRLE